MESCAWSERDSQGCKGGRYEENEGGKGYEWG